MVHLFWSDGVERVVILADKSRIETRTGNKAKWLNACPPKTNIGQGTLFASTALCGECKMSKK